MRALTCLAALVLIDAAALRAAGPQPRIDADWRAPERLPSAALPHAFQALEAASIEPAPVVAFTGASPTWGDGLESGEDALPARWARHARSGGSPSVVNLAFNGQLTADTGTIARAAARHADVVFVQVTYRGFSPEARGDAMRRFPELPRLLGEPVTAIEASATLTRRTPPGDPTGSVDRALRRVWRLYALRDTIAARWLGAAPDEALRGAWEDLTMPGFVEAGDPSAGSFDDLPPDEQSLLVEEWASDSAFELSPDEPELAALDALAADLASRDVTTVVYLAPFNTAALESFGYLDRAGFERNTATMRRAVERHGVRFVDLNGVRPWRSGDFIDISHTTAAGTDTAARLLWAETSPTIGVAR